MYYGLKNKAGRDFVIVILVFCGLSTVAVGLRLVSKRMKRLPLQLDDYLILISLMCVYCSVGICTASVTRGGVGNHFGLVVPLADLKYTLKLLIPLQGLYGIGLGCVKTSLMVLYLRIFGTTKKFRITIYVAMVIVWGWAFSIVIEAFLLCRPCELGPDRHTGSSMGAIASNWDPTIPGKCGNRNAAFVAAGALNMLTDIMVLLLPVPHIWSLQLQVGRKVGLLATFGLGIFVSAISIIRMKFLLSLNLADATFSLPDPFMWSVVEPELAVIAACIPLMRPFFTKVARPWFGGSSSRGTKNSRNGLNSDGTKKQFSRLNDSNASKNNDYALETIGGGRMNKVSSEANGYTVGVEGGKPYRIYEDGRSKTGIEESVQTLEDSDSGKSNIKIVGRGALPGGIRVQTEYSVE
ncbi:uncharacterized protein BDZ99DRAFT_513920 [Mytilinidion resinicola]|uniref:Rhodopsin domain-containing protein n=1 Tax=Mytilinidion resinicola TaxID=574789 RepID=A0A6A6Z986_9PEZI|nr:uncharacterized protein BDZ99DRAFT_513920 [Mytilinidion resinicola]KAF2817692.1 hypothetical protein BDZ99DRAFT_513920 [Mytilinidion resinicola]